MLIGFTALVALPIALKNPDTAFMVMVQTAFPPWVLGLVGGAGALACMIPAAELSLTTSMLVTRNVYGRTAGRNMTDDQMGRMARLMVVALAIVALYLSIFKSTALVDLLLSGYMGVTQFFPMIVLGLFWKKSTKAAAFASLIVGEGLVFYLLILNKMSIVAVPALGGHVNTGFLALVVNIAVFVVVSLVTNKSDDDVLRA
jgi:SSS family solute:Na+ symporter